MGICDYVSAYHYPASQFSSITLQECRRSCEVHWCLFCVHILQVDKRSQILQSFIHELCMATYRDSWKPSWHTVLTLWKGCSSWKTVMKIVSPHIKCFLHRHVWPLGRYIFLTKGFFLTCLSGETIKISHYCITHVISFFYLLCSLCGGGCGRGIKATVF